MNPMQADLYPSRQEDQPSWQERLDPVVYRSDLENAPIAAELVERFERDGYLVIPICSAPTKSLFRAELERMRQDPAVAGSGKTIKEPDSGAIRSVFAIHRTTSCSPASQPTSAPPASPASSLAATCAHQSRMNFKPGFTGKEFYWHSDFETWHIEDGMPRMRCLSCSILLTDNEPHNGPLMLMPGSHKHYVRCVGATPENHYEVPAQARSASRPEQPERAGQPLRHRLRHRPRQRGVLRLQHHARLQRQHHAQRAEQSVLRLQPRG